MVNGQNVTDRVQYIGCQAKTDFGLVIVIQFKDGSTQSYALIDVDEVENEFGQTTWSDIRRVNPNTGGFLPERFTGTSKISMDGSGIFYVDITNNQGTSILNIFGFMRFV